MLNKIEQYLFYFLLFAIPFQIRKVLYYPDWIFSEWQAVSVYGTDILIIALFIFWFWKTRFKTRLKTCFPYLTFKTHDYFLLAFVVIAAISIKNSSAVYLSLFSFIKLIEFVLFYFYIKTYAVYRFDFLKSLLALIAGGVFQAIIAISQFLKQSSLGLWFLGESLIGPDMRGVAVFYNFVGEKVMRSYGTTPHPNILAAYLFIAIFAFYLVHLYYGFHHKKPSYFSRLDSSLVFLYIITLFAFLFTFSRVIIFLWVFSFSIRAILVLTKERFREKFFKISVNKIKLTQILLASLLVVITFSILYWPEATSRFAISSSDEAVQLRIYYAGESLKSGFNLFGIGIGNFVNWLKDVDPGLARRFYQPVHNIYLLIYTETGVLGASAFILFLIFLIKDYISQTKLAKFYHISYLLVVLSFLFIGFFDHFLWTLQQGMLMFWLVLGGLNPASLQAKVRG